MNSTKKMAAEAENLRMPGKADVVESAMTLCVRGVERLAEIQKRSIELAAQQNTELLASWKKMAHVVPGVPDLFMLDLASNAFDRAAETQKGAIDLVVEQSHAVAAILKQRKHAVSEPAQKAVAAMQHTMERSVAAQKRALEYSAAQTKTTFETAKKQFGLSGTPAEAVADSLQRGVDTFVETQKELLDIAAKPFQ
jgi:hypothetical protein